MEQQPVNPGTPKEQARAIRIFCLAIMAGSFIFAVIMLVLHYTTGPAMKDLEPKYRDIMGYVVAGVALICFLTAQQKYRKLLNAHDQSAGLNSRLSGYRTALVMYMALCEGPALFAIIVFFLTGLLWLMIVVALMLAAMLVKFPFDKKIISELRLDWKEQQELE